MEKWMKWGAITFRRLQRNRWVSLFLITFIGSLVITMVVAFGGTIFHIMQAFPNKHRILADYRTIDRPVFLYGQPYSIGAIENDGHLKLPLNLVRDWIDPYIWYEGSTDTLVITREDQVLSLKKEEINATLNDKPISLPSVINEINSQWYIPVELLMKTYPMMIRKSMTNDALFLFKQGDVIQWGQSLVRASTPIRTGNSIKFPIVSDLSPEEQVMILSEKQGWYHIQQITTGDVGYVTKESIALAQPEVIPYTPQATTFTPWKPDKQKINLTFDYVGNKNPDTRQIPAMPGVNVVSPTWITLADEKGNLRNTADSAYIKWAKNRNYQIWPTFNNQFDPELTHIALSSYEGRVHIIRQILQLAKQYKFDGINIDFEKVDLKDKANLVQFIRELTPFLHEQGLVVSMDVTVKSFSEQWSLCYNRPALIQTVDYMVIMAYDEHAASSSKAGSVSSLPWVEHSIERLFEEDKLPAEKLILGVPFYTRIWTEEVVDGQLQVSSQAVGMNTINQLIKQRSLTPSLSSKTGQHYIEYIENAKKFKVWIEDEFSMKGRIELVHRYELAGIASWRRGFELPSMWNMINTELHTGN